MTPQSLHDVSAHHAPALQPFPVPIPSLVPGSPGWAQTNLSQAQPSMAALRSPAATSSSDPADEEKLDRTRVPRVTATDRRGCSSQEPTSPLVQGGREGGCPAPPRSHTAQQTAKGLAWPQQHVRRGQKPSPLHDGPFSREQDPSAAGAQADAFSLREGELTGCTKRCLAGCTASLSRAIRQETAGTP